MTVADASSPNVYGGEIVTLMVTDTPEAITFTITLKSSHNLVDDVTLTIDGFTASTVCGPGSTSMIEPQLEDLTQESG